MGGKMTKKLAGQMLLCTYEKHKGTNPGTKAYSY